MEVGRINNINTIPPAYKGALSASSRYSEPSFKSGPVTNGGTSKKFWLMMRKLGNGMKNITEIKNAFIAAIGTGIIAPLVILVSPGKGDKKDKDKKFLQALRQPLSAGLSLGFQVPATMFINRQIDRLAYDKKVKFFRDDVIGDLIPTEKYMAKMVNPEEIEALEADFEKVVNGKSLKQELESKIKYDYEQVGLEISGEDLAKRVNKDKKDFLREKVAKDKVDVLKRKKIQEILQNPDKYPKIADIKPIDLVTEGYQDRVEQLFKEDFNKLEKDANLSFFDKTMRLMGFETKKTKQLKKAQKAFKEEKGLQRLQEMKPEIFNDKAKRVQAYIDAYEAKAKKSFEGKKFWISLLVNLFMVTISCFTLNWIHPKVNKWLENKRAQKDMDNNQKVEVK